MRAEACDNDLSGMSSGPLLAHLDLPGSMRRLLGVLGVFALFGTLLVVAAASPSGAVPDEILPVNVGNSANIPPNPPGSGGQRNILADIVCVGNSTYNVNGVN